MTKGFWGYCPIVAILCLVLLAGCKKDQQTVSNGSQTGTREQYFKTPFQDESEFIVQTIISDLAEMMYFASKGVLPDAKNFSIKMREKSSSAFRSPVYEVEMKFEPNQAPLRAEIAMNGPIWAAESYWGFEQQLVKHLGGSPTRVSGALPDQKGIVQALEDASAITLERENLILSAQLENDFKNPALHAQAAFLMGVFALRESSGDFYDVRLPLCRMTAHLVFAMSDTNTFAGSVHAELAQSMLDILMNNQSAALSKLTALESRRPECAAWIRALRARVTGDYRPLEEVKFPTKVERLAWFEASSRSADPSLAWRKLSETELKSIPDFCRIANMLSPSVETGHDLMAISLPFELAEIDSVYLLSQSRRLDRKNFVQELNRLPERCVTRGSKGDAVVRIIGWGQWAMFCQRQLGHALVQNFDMLERRWAVHEDAQTYASRADELFTGLRLYPFVRRLNCTDTAAYHKAVDDCLPVLIETPHLVSPMLWNHFCWKPKFAPLYKPVANSRVDAWHKHNPPPGTVYDPRPRCFHPGLTGRPDAVAQLENLHKQAPYNFSICFHLANRKYGQHATFDQLKEIYQPVLDYSAPAMFNVAKAALDNVEIYEPLFTRAARIAPGHYFSLGDYFAARNEEAKAAAYYQMGIDLASDAVLASKHSIWLIRYYLRQGAKDKARKIADMAGETYSASGLSAKAGFLEETGDFSGAQEWYKKLEERYNQSEALSSFYERYKAKTGDNRFEAEEKSHFKKAFPAGVEKVELKQFRDPPVDGVELGGDSDLTRAAGVKQGDVIVAYQGIRVHNLDQYQHIRSSSPTDELTLIVWQPGKGYTEVRAILPKRRFGIPINQYRPR